MKPKGKPLTTNKEFILGLDLDGVCADYVGELRKFVAKYTGRNEETFPEPTNWDFTKSGWNITPEEYLTYHERAVNEGLFKKAQPFKGVSQALWELSDADVHIRIITHRLIKHRQHQQVTADTCEWLDTSDVPYRDLCFVAAKSDVNADLFIDDAPHNLTNLMNAGKNVVAFNQLYNEHIDCSRVYNWEEAKEYVLESKRNFDKKQNRIVTLNKTATTNAMSR